LFLAALAAASMFVAFRNSNARDLLLPAPLRDADRLAMVSWHASRAPIFAEIPVGEFRARVNRMPDAVDALAFYETIRTFVHDKPFVLGVASANLFEMLGVRVSGPGLILSRPAWRRFFGSDPRIVGRTVEIAGERAVVAGMVSAGVWQLPGAVDAWLPDERKLDRSAPDSRGFLVAHLRTTANRETLQWPAAVPNERGLYGTLRLAPLAGGQVLAPLLIFLAGAFVLLRATTALGLGEYPATGYAPPRAARVRRWMFLAIKIALLLPIVFCVPLAAGILPMVPHGVLAGLVLAIRWALRDQRNRCPVCLCSLSHPVRIGGASHTFLEWYGTEFLCARGHGLLHVPEIRTSFYAEQRWMYLAPL
jgi:hypothetical protein